MTTVNAAYGIRLAKRVEWWQQKLTPLGIAGYQILAVSIVDETPAGDHAQASVGVNNDYDRVRFWFKREYLEEASPADLDLTIIHEWLHVAMRDHDTLVSQTIESWLTPHSRDDFMERWEHEQEGLIDRLARALHDSKK